MTHPVIPLLPRSGEILDSIKGMFAAKGFDGASMQDLARAAGMSAGNFYRYFPSKDAIVAALVQRDLDEVQREFTLIIQSPEPRATFLQVIRMRIETVDPDEGPIWAEIEAGAARRPELAALLEAMVSSITASMVTVFARIAGIGEAEANARYGAHARLFMMLIRGVSMETHCSVMRGHSADPELAALVLSIIDRTLTEIAAGTSPTAVSSSERSA